jgi:hypothetical protein
MEESKEAFQVRMEALAKDHEARLQKSWEEMQGTEWADTYCMGKADEALKQGDRETTLFWAERLLQNSPKRGSSHHFVGVLHWNLGEETAALAQFGIALAVEPSYYPSHRLMAKILAERGERVAAEAILEQGWQQKRKSDRMFGWKHGKKEREEFFKLN